MEFTLTLALPRDEYSVPVARRVLKTSLTVLGVRDDVVHDIELALTEACTNVLDHAAETDEYEVSAGVDGTACVIEVADRGQGFDGTGPGLGEAAPDAEEGRGIQLMRALVDQVSFTNRQASGKGGGVVHLEKQLEWHDDAAVKKLDDDTSESV